MAVERQSLEVDWIKIKPRANTFSASNYAALIAKPIPCSSCDPQMQGGLDLMIADFISKSRQTNSTSKKGYWVHGLAAGSLDHDCHFSAYF